MNSWDIYRKIKDLIDAGDYKTALFEIDSNRINCDDIKTHISGLEAYALEVGGDLNKAISVLVNVSEPNFWTFYKLGNLYRSNGDLMSGYKAFQNAHALLGWTESSDKNYIFTHDYFSPNIEKWQDYFDRYIIQAPLKALEIGSWQGGSALWLLDKIIFKRGGSLTCVDTFEGSSEHQNWIGDLPLTIEEIFDSNVDKSGNDKFCRKIKGYSQNVLRSIISEKFDFIYIDGAHEARYVIEDAILSFGMLEDGGFLLFDDYDFSFSNDEVQNSSRAIDFFIATFHDEIEVIDKGRQVLLRKIAR